MDAFKEAMNEADRQIKMRQAVDEMENRLKAEKNAEIRHDLQKHTDRLLRKIEKAFGASFKKYKFKLLAEIEVDASSTQLPKRVHGANVFLYQTVNSARNQYRGPIEGIWLDPSGKILCLVQHTPTGNSHVVYDPVWNFDPNSPDGEDEVIKEFVRRAGRSMARDSLGSMVALMPDSEGSLRGRPYFEYEKEMRSRANDRFNIFMWLVLVVGIGAFVLDRFFL